MLLDLLFIGKVGKGEGGFILMANENRYVLAVYAGTGKVTLFHDCIASV